MRRTTAQRSPMAWGPALLLAALAVACSKPQASTSNPPAPDSCAVRLATFDTLDFTVFSGQHWDRLGESHATDIVVTWPDGHETSGIERHIADLKGMFVYAPDTRIADHPIKLCSGDYTAVTGVMTGTFSQPMPMAGSKPIPPTGKSFKLTMATIGHWKGPTMDHEWLFWDNHEFMRQIGLAK